MDVASPGMSAILRGAAAAIAAVALLSTAPAHADDQSYLDGLRAHGAPLKPWTEGEWVSEGHKMCNELRHGVSPANVAAEVTQTDPAMFMDVLQHQLCPDTLR
jgi:Protein of unknown function (DUF732)